ncbi:GMC family oxidoreductase N-terminal domain-containing protein [Streptomyces sp. SID3343]|uniref:GMC family oxidoreductase N-terminal domain-containing protein n=1 Tax=Streptomyces sp. SID3343 TaxID=2690260 RepID=UPI0019290E36|nr:GMC family oxidoreductase N-terminal domain-containing protein [Streptomyces sp. SID3343]
MPLLNDAQRDVLRAIVDTVVPSVTRADDPTGFWATPGSAVAGVVPRIEELLADRTDPQQQDALRLLLDGIGEAGLVTADASTREGLLEAVSSLAPEVAVAVATLRGAAALYAYSLTDAQGRNPFWAGVGNPGPQAAPTGPVHPPLPLYSPHAGETLHADVVVVGSGAGGGTIAGLLACAGKDVVVLEAGDYFHEGDFNQLESWAVRSMFYREGFAQTADGGGVLLAGHTLGGGTTVNWQNWVEPRRVVREQWADDGLTDVAGPEWDAHVAAVAARVSANADCSDLNGPHRRMREAAERLGWSFKVATRNVDPARYDPKTAGYTQFGDRSGAKQGTVNTYLRDAADAGARIVVRADVRTVLTRAGVASGVEARVRDRNGNRAWLTVKAPTVVLAAGALETPAILLRSGLGGPAVGRNLRVHPSSGMFGVYADPQDPWWGPPQAGVVDEFADLRNGHGYLVEGSQYFTGMFAFQFTAQARTGLEHKQAMADLDRTADFLFVLRDRGAGHVELDADGEARHVYAVEDPRDVELFRHGLGTLARLHEAAGAQEIRSGAPGLRSWRRGDDVEAWIRAHDDYPIGPGGLLVGSAHQMGTARMGRDRDTAAANPDGELYDTRGVWIGDTSAFPSACGSNPMLSCMALAHRTAERVLGAVGP